MPDTLFGRVDVERGIGSVILPEFGGLERRTHILLRHDSQTSPFAPASGLLGGVEYSSWDRNPIGTGGFSQLEGRGSLFHTVRSKDRVFVQFGGGTSFGTTAPVPYKFTLGGLFRLSGYENDEFRGDHYLLARGRLYEAVSVGCRTSSAAGCMRRWLSTRDRRSTRGMRHRDAPALASGLALDTLIGPVSAQIAFNKDGGSRFFFLMGRTVPTR